MGFNVLNQNPLPSGMPSPELGAGPFPLFGQSVLSYPLPSGTQSPELGAGPGDTESTSLQNAYTDVRDITKIVDRRIASLAFFKLFTGLNGLY